MEAVILLGILGFGLFVNKDKDKSEPDDGIYNTRQFESSQFKEQLSANELIKQIQNSVKKQESNSIEGFQVSSNNVILKDGKEYILLNDGITMVEKTDFLTNNQGYSANPPDYDKANIDFNNSNNLLIFANGGSGAQYWKSKSENNQKPLFNVKPDRDPNYSNSNNFYQKYDQNRFNISKYHNEQLPNTNMNIQKIDAKDPVNQDIGRAIAERRKTDNIRNITNQKSSYEQRINSGKALNDKRGLQANIDKNKPYRDYKNNPGLWGVGTSSILKERHQSDQIIKTTNRSNMNKQYLGIAESSVPHERTRNNYIECPSSRKDQLGTDTQRNIMGPIGNIDYNQLGYTVYPNEREVTEDKTYEGIINGNKAPMIGIQDEIKPTKKQTTIDNNYNGITGNQVSKETIGMQDTLRQTVKGTTLEYNRDGNLSGRLEPTIRIQDEILPTTKDTTLYNDLLNAKSIHDSTLNRNNYNNMEMNATKEIISQGRKPTQNSVKLMNGADTMNININKLDTDYMTHHIKGADRKYLLSNKLPDGCGCDIGCETTKAKIKLNDIELMVDRIDPNILTPFNDNPYTKPLNSVF